MITLQIGKVLGKQFKVDEEVSMVNSCREELMRKFKNVPLKGNQAAVIVHQEGGMLRRGHVFDLNSVKTIL